MWVNVCVRQRGVLFPKKKKKKDYSHPIFTLLSRVFGLLRGDSNRSNLSDKVFLWWSLRGYLMGQYFNAVYHLTGQREREKGNDEASIRAHHGCELTLMNVNKLE